MKKNKVFKALSIIYSVLVLVTFFSVPVCAQSPAKPAGELRIGVSSLFTETFHPFGASITARKSYYEPLYDYLVGVDENGNFNPNDGIAYKWEEARDRLSWTFWIRDGIKFHDGTPLTLEDVKYSLEQSLSKDNPVLVLPQHGHSVEIVPPDKVVVKLQSPFPLLSHYMTAFGMGGGIILYKKYIDRVSKKEYESNPIATGPYKFLEKKEGSYIKYVAQDYHYRVGTPKYKYLTFKILPEEGTRVAALRAGEVDLIEVGLSMADKLSREGIPIHRKKDAVHMFLDFLRVYQPDNPLHKKEVREALVYAIDKASILKHTLMGQGRLIGNVYMMFTWSVSYKEYPVTPYDPRKAKELLAKAGYPNGFTIYLYSYVTSIPEQKIVNEAIAGYWKAIGMDVKIIELNAGAFFPIWTKNKEPLGPAAFVHSWSNRPRGVWSSQYHSDPKYIWSQVQDKVLDRLIEKLETTYDRDKFIEAERACEDRVLEMFYKSAMASSDIVFAASKDVPEWNLGRGVDSYRYEYVGAKK